MHAAIVLVGSTAPFGSRFEAAPVSGSRLVEIASVEIEEVPAGEARIAVTSAPEASARSGGARLPEPSSGASRAVPSHGLEPPASPGELVTAAEGAPAPNAPREAARPRALDLRALGVGADNPFLDLQPGPRSRGHEINDRLQRSLAQAATDSDRRVGLGPSGAVLRVLEQAAPGANVPLNSRVVFGIEIDAAGRVTDVRVLEATISSPAWKELAERARAALASKTLAARKQRPMRLRIALSSRVALPSGRAPGMDLRLFDQPVGAEGESRSAQLQIFSDTGPLSMQADVADIAARPRRMIHAHVLSEEVF